MSCPSPRHFQPGCDRCDFLQCRKQWINQAIDLLGQEPSIEIVKTSSLIETDPQGGPAQGKFLNGVVKIRCRLSAIALLHRLQDIEKKLQRVRSVANAPRTIDLDILLYGDQIIKSDELTIPHPKMFERDFVLGPLAEIEPDLTLLKDRLKQAKNIRP